MTIDQPSAPLKFALSFIGLFLCFYYFNIFFFGITSPGNHYSAFLDEHLNYIRGLRNLLLNSTAGFLRLFGYGVVFNDTELLVEGGHTIQVIYSCLGLGVISFFTAFVLAYPKPWKAKIIFIIIGILTIESLNVLRLAWLARFWSWKKNQVIDHHIFFNSFIYILVAISLYYWVKPKIRPKSDLKFHNKSANQTGVNTTKRII